MSEYFNAVNLSVVQNSSNFEVTINGYVFSKYQEISVVSFTYEDDEYVSPSAADGSVTYPSFDEVPSEILAQLPPDVQANKSDWIVNLYTNRVYSLLKIAKMTSFCVWDAYDHINLPIGDVPVIQETTPLPEKGQKVKNVYAIFYDQSENHVCGWTDNQLKVQAFYNDETGDYELSTTALSVTSWYQPNHKYAVTLFAEDEAGNVASVGSTDETYGDQLNFRVKETVAPVVTMISPSDGSIIGDSETDIIFAIVDGDESNIGSGIDSNTFSLTVGSHEFIWDDVTSVDGAENQYKVHVTDLAGGIVGVELSVSDNDGNATTKNMSFVVQTVGPDLYFVEPASDILGGKGFPSTYTVVLKVKPSGGVALTKLTLVHKVRGTNSGESEPNQNYTKDTYNITEFGEPDTDGYYTVSQDVRIEGNAINAYETCYTYNEFIATAYDVIDNTTSVSRTITIDNANPIIYDVVTESTEIVAASGKIKIQFRLYDGPPAPTVTIVESNREIYDNSRPYNSTTLQVGQSYQPYAIVEERPHVDMGLGLQSGYRLEFTKPSPGLSDFLPLTTTLLDGSNSEVGRYRVELSEPMVLTDDDIGSAWKDSFVVGSKRYRHLKQPKLSPGLIYVAPKTEIISVTPSKCNYSTLGTMLPTFKVKVTPANTSAPTGAYLSYNGNASETNISPTITKIEEESTSEYSVYAITSTKTFSASSYKITSYMKDGDVSFRLKVLYSTGSVYCDGVISYEGCEVEIFDVSSTTTTVDYVPTFKVKVTPDFGNVNAILMKFGSKAYATLTSSFTSTKETFDEYAVHTFTATSAFGTSVTGLVSGTPETIIQNIKVKVSPFATEWEKTGTLTYEIPKKNLTLDSTVTVRSTGYNAGTVTNDGTSSIPSWTVDRADSKEFTVTTTGADSLTYELTYNVGVTSTDYPELTLTGNCEKLSDQDGIQTWSVTVYNVRPDGSTAGTTGGSSTRIKFVAAQDSLTLESGYYSWATARVS